MRIAISRLLKCLVLPVSLCLLTQNLTAQIKVFPEQPVAGQQAKVLVLNDRRAGTSVTWNFQSATDSNDSASTVPEPITGNDSLVTVTFAQPGEYLVLATIHNPDDSVKSVSLKVAVGGSATVATSEAADVLATGQEVESDLGLAEFARRQMLSKETLVDELDQRFLESCETIAQVYDRLAGEAPTHNLTDESDAAIEAEKEFFRKTRDEITAKLEEIHPSWERFRRLNSGRKSPGERAWDAYRNNFVDQLNEIAETTDDNFRTNFSYKEAWLEFAKGLRAAAGTKTEYIKEYNKNRQIYEAYMRNNSGTSSNRGGECIPKCPLLIWLGLF